MGMGTLRVETTTAFDALPVPSADVAVKDSAGQILFRLQTDQSGSTDTVSLYAPDAAHTLSPYDQGPYYAAYTVDVVATGYEPVTVYGVQIFDTQRSVLPVQMQPAARSLTGEHRVVQIPDNSLHSLAVRNQQGAELNPSARLARPVTIPDYITVHIGAPSTGGRNVRVSFTDYIKNVASSEIYPTWPRAALEANIFCQISYALNRVYTEWYPSRGYAFHITSSTSYDQYFVEGRNIYDNISNLVDNIFNMFVRRQGHAEPFFTQYCNGTTVTCSGLSQWGTVTLANQGLSALQILLRYYPSDIQLVSTDQIAGITESYPGTALRQGSQGESVRHMQVYLNRIRVNYPLIQQIASPNGTFGADTTAAVRTFQSIFSLAADGIVGKATWYKIIQIYNSVTKLASMESEGERIGLGATPPTSVIRQGAKGRDVVQLQFILNYIGEFYSEIPVVLQNSQFDALTTQAVTAFQRLFHLSADGIVGPATWNKLYEVYHSIEENVSSPDPGPGVSPPSGVNPPYPGVLLRNGSRGDSVRLMQQYLNAIFQFCPGYVPLGTDGIFGAMTENAVRSFQRMMGLSADGIIGPATWEEIVLAYQSV